MWCEHKFLLFCHNLRVWQRHRRMNKQLSHGYTGRCITCSGTVKTISKVQWRRQVCCEEGQSWKVGHGALTAKLRAGCSSCSMTDSFVSNEVLVERALSCWHLHQLISQTTQYLESWLSDLLQIELKMKLLEVEEARAQVHHSWRRHWQSLSYSNSTHMAHRIYDYSIPSCN